MGFHQNLPRAIESLSDLVIERLKGIGTIFNRAIYQPLNR
jgi:hypothetical protein